MASRYGRNQKRRHRARIAELERIERAVLKDNSKAWGMVKQLQLELKTLLEAIDAVQPLSAILPAKIRTMDPEWLRYGPYETVRKTNDFWDGVNVDLKPGVMHVPLERIRHYVYEIAAEIRNDPLKFEHCIHLIARSPKDTNIQAYYIDSVALAQAYSLPEVFERIFRKLIDALVKAQQERVVRV